MAGKSGLATNDPREPRTRRAGRTDPASLVEGLERLRDSIFLRLEQLEALVEENAALAGLDPSDREQALRERVALLEAAQARLMAEVKRREQEWQELLTQLEDDRRLLAEAWEKVERAQLEVQPATPAQPVRPVPMAVGEHAAPQGYRPPVSTPPDDLTTREILRQFQALKNDVRRSAGGPGRSRS
ncbi:MAG: hypothetical protein U0794_04370 [Isosphaeraceae bacterium]